MVSKRGIAPSIMIIAFIFIATFLVIFAGIFIYGFGLVDDSFESIDFTLGNTSFQETYDNTLGRGLQQAQGALSLFSIVTLFGMIIVMLIVGYGLKDQPRLMIILDIAILIVAIIPGIYLSSTFSNYIQANASLLAVYSNDLSLGSKFILNLPIIQTIAGALIMVVSYIGFKPKREASVYGESL